MLFQWKTTMKSWRMNRNRRSTMMVTPVWTMKTLAQSLNQRWRSTLTKPTGKRMQQRCTVHSRRRGLQVPICSHLESASLIDSSPDYAQYMAYMIVHLFYNAWTGYAKWLELPCAKAKELFEDGKRHDAIGPWGHLSEINPDTGVSRDVTDDEVLAYGRSLEIDEDPAGSHLLNRLRSNQLISQLIR